MSKNWTPEEDEKFKALWLEGKSATQISRVLPGRTRNAVLGRVFRLGLPQRATPIGATRIRQVHVADVKRVVVKPPKPDTDEDEDPGPMSPPIDTMALRDGHCKWPYVVGNDTHYCGRSPKEERPFCEHHCRKAYQPKMTKSAA